MPDSPAGRNATGPVPYSTPDPDNEGRVFILCPPPFISGTFPNAGHLFLKKLSKNLKKFSIRPIISLYLQKTQIQDTARHVPIKVCISPFLTCYLTSKEYG